MPSETATQINIFKEAVKLLREDKRNLAQISRETGLGYFWLRKLKRGEIKNPGYNRIAELFIYLA